MTFIRLDDCSQCAEYQLRLWVSITPEFMIMHPWSEDEYLTSLIFHLMRCLFIPHPLSVTPSQLVYQRRSPYIRVQRPLALSPWMHFTYLPIYTWFQDNGWSKRFTPWANFLVDIWGHKLLGASLAATPIFGPKCQYHKKGILLMICGAQLIDVVLLCSGILWFSKLAKNDRVMAKKWKPIYGRRGKNCQFWPITWPNINIFGWIKKHNVCSYNILAIADLYVNIATNGGLKPNKPPKSLFFAFISTRIFR